jgi:hypothetical protein
MARSSCVAVHGAVLQTVPMRRGVVGGGGERGASRWPAVGERLAGLRCDAINLLHPTDANEIAADAANLPRFSSVGVV